MKEVELLKENLSGLFNWNQGRIDFLAKFVLALLKAQTVNLKKIAEKFSGKAEPDSHYKRIQRFLKGYDVDFANFAKIIVALMPLSEKWVLCMDRTTWKFGLLNINILLLGVAYKGFCIPLFWVLLDKRGNSNTKERIEMMERFLKTFPLEKIDCLTADREFIGGEWIRYLKSKRIPFRIRVKKDTKVLSSRSHERMDMYLLFRGLRCGQSMVLNKPRKVWGISLYLVGLRTSDEYVLLITDQKPETALSDYKKRWDIETLFGCLKTRGFNFEDTHLTKHERVCKLVALMTLTYCWCILQGEYIAQNKPIPVKKHGRQAMSIFRKGLESLSNIIENMSYKFGAYKLAIAFLSCT